MCCCGKPTINGEPGYHWNSPNDDAGIHPVNPPDLSDGEVLLHDEPGRCGGIDSHSFHYRVTKWHGSLYLLVRHGAGDERIRLSLYDQQADILADLDSNARYWLLNAIYHAYRDGKTNGRNAENLFWNQAAADKRIKTRKTKFGVKVRVEPKVITTEPAAEVCQ